MSAKQQLSATMAYVLATVTEKGGKLVRYQGGYWGLPNASRRSHDGKPDWWTGTSTVEALVSRGELQYCEWQEGRRGRFPIAAKVG